MHWREPLLEQRIFCKIIVKSSTWSHFNVSGLHMAHKEKTEPTEIELPTGFPWMFKLADWFHEHGQKVVYGAIGLVAVLIFALVWTQQRKGASEKAYVSAEIAFNNFFKLASDQTDPAKEEPFVTLKEAIDVTLNWEVVMMDRFASFSSDRSDGTGSRLWRSGVKAVVEEDFPFFEEFSKTSLFSYKGTIRKR